MAAKTPRSRGAMVRASRARSRVEAERKARSGKRGGLEDGRGGREQKGGRKGDAPHRPAHASSAEAEVKRVKRGKDGAGTERGDKGRAAQARGDSRHERQVSGWARRKGEHKGDTVEARAGGRRRQALKPPASARGDGGRGLSRHEHGQAIRVEKASWNEIRPAMTVVLGAVLLASLAALLWIYTFTGVLNVKSVEVEGNLALDAEYLRSLCGITGDTHLLRMDVKAVEKALLSEPYVAAVDISRRYPHTVRLRISERIPTGVIFQNGKYNLVDQEGVVLEAAQEIPQGLLEIKDVEVPLLFPGVEVSGAGFQAVTSLLGSLPDALREVATAVGLSRSRGLYLEGRGTVVIYGEASSLSRKNGIALMALTELVDCYGAVEYIDVSFPEHPVIKPVQ